MPSEADILEYIEQIASIAVAGAIIYTAWIGRSQLKEMRGERLLDRRAEHAEKIIKMIYAAKDAISRVRRFPSIEDRKEAEENLKRYGYSDTEISENKILISSICASKNIIKEQEIFLEIFRYIPTSRIIFDSSIASNLNQLYIIYRKIAYRNVLKIRHKGKQEQKNFDDLFPVRQRMRKDEIGNEISNIVENIESKIQEIIGITDD